MRLSQEQPSDEDEISQNSTARVDGHRVAVQQKDTAHVEHLTHGAKRDRKLKVSHSGARGPIATAAVTEYHTVVWKTSADHAVAELSRPDREQSGIVSVRSRGRGTIEMCGGQMTSSGEQKLTSEMMKCAQQRRRTLRHESQQQLKYRGTRIARIKITQQVEDVQGGDMSKDRVRTSANDASSCYSEEPNATDQ